MGVLVVMSKLLITIRFKALTEEAPDTILEMWEMRTAELTDLYKEKATKYIKDYYERRGYEVLDIEFEVYRYDNQRFT